MVLHAALIALATFYATYVITRSEFPLVLRVRNAVFARWGEGTWQAYLATCPWCAAFYVAALLTLGGDLATHVPLPVYTWLAAAGVTGAIMEVVETMWHVRSE